MKRTQISLLIALLLQGCVSQSYVDNKADADKVQQRIDEIRPTGVLNNVDSISRPPINTTPIDGANHIAWLNDVITVNVSHLPLSIVLDSIMQGTDVQTLFANDINANMPVTMNTTTTR